MLIYAFCQKGNSSHWTSQYLKGIKEETKRKGHELQILECSLDAADLPQGPSDAGASIVISGTYNWTSGICTLLSSKNIKPIVVGYDQSDDITATGYVLMDYKKAIYDLLDYFISSGRRRVALFAVSLQSPADKLKSDAFLSYIGENGERFNQKDIFYFRQMTINTCQSFISVCSDYDAVIGTNDVSTSILLDMLKTHGIRVPEDIFIATFADTSLSKSTTNELTLALLNCKAVGVQAAKSCILLSKAHNVSSSVIKLGCEIEVKGSTANIPYQKTFITAHIAGSHENDSSFFSDPDVSEIVLAEMLLSKCDTLDLDILRAIEKKEKYIDIAERLHVSENTVKYRIKRLLNIVGFDSRSKLTALMSGFLRQE